MLRATLVVAVAFGCLAATAETREASSRVRPSDHRITASSATADGSESRQRASQDSVRGFDALLNGTSVILRWATSGERHTTAFIVEHEILGRFEQIGSVDAKGGEAQESEYRFGIGFLEVGDHRFRLRRVDSEGVSEYAAGLEVSVGLPEEYVLSDAHPNPFNPRTDFSLTVRRSQVVRIELLNSLGKRVAMIFEGDVSANERRSFTIEAKTLASGVYFYRVAGETFAATRLVALVK